MVAGLWAVIEFVFPKKTEQEKSPPLFQNLDADKIREIQWQRGAEVIHLKKDKSWEITQPITVPADSKVMEGLLDSLTHLRPERTFPASKADLKEFGLDRPRVKIRFLSQGQWSELQVGKKTVVGPNHYVKISNSPDLFLVEDYSIKTLDQDLTHLKEKKFKKGP